MRVYLAFAKSFEANPGENALAGISLSIDFVQLMQHVQ